MSGTQFTETDLERAVAAGRQRRTAEAHALEVHYDAKRDSVVLRMAHGWTLAVERRAVEELKIVPRDHMKEVRLSPAGSVLHLDALDIHVDLNGLLETLLTPGWMSRALGKRGGQVKSPMKSRAARRNGQKGGRPRKRAVA